MNDRKGFGSRIKAAREHQKFTLDNAAELCDVSLSTWKQYERGERLPSLSKFIKLCLVLQVRPEYLLGPELDEQKENLDTIEQLKLMIEELNSDDVALFHTSISKRLEIINSD